MGAAPPRRAPRSAAGILLSLCLALVAAMCVEPLPACDLWWQLKTGELIWVTHHVPHGDVFSFTAPGRPWVVQEWLAEVILFALFRFCSPDALVLYKMVGAALAFGLVFWRCRLRSASPALAAGLTALGAYAASPYFDMRPQMFSYGMLAGVLLLLEQWRRGAWPRAVWLLPVVMLIWVNLHAGFMLLFAILGAEIAAEVVGRGFRPAEEAEDRPGGDGPEPAPRDPRFAGPDGKRLATLAAVAVLCGLVGLVNPNGLEAYRYPLLLLSRKEMLDSIQEWTSPNFHVGWAKPYGYLLLLLTLSLAVSRPGRFRDLFLMLGLLHSSLYSVRNLPVFAIACAPIVADGLSEAGRRLQAWMAERRFAAMRWEAGAAVAVGLLLSARIAMHARTFPRGNWFAYCAMVPWFPVRACEYLMSDPAGSRVCNYYPWGGYCIWRMWPRYKVALDGRAEVYFDCPFVGSKAAGTDKLSPEERLILAGADSVLVPTTDPLVQTLPRRPGWRVVYQDEQAVVLRQVGGR